MHPLSAVSTRAEEQPEGMGGGGGGGMVSAPAQVHPLGTVGGLGGLGGGRGGMVSTLAQVHPLGAVSTHAEE